MSERRDTSSPGQALEFEIWSDLIKQSQGLLHVFLPLLDRGLDAVLHRLTDGRYIPVQIKGKGEMVEGMVEIVVRADSLVDDNALLIASLMIDLQDSRCFKSGSSPSPFPSMVKCSSGSTRQR